MAQLLMHPVLSLGQQVENVPQAFDALSSEPEVLLINNKIKSHTAMGIFRACNSSIKTGPKNFLFPGVPDPRPTFYR